MSVDSELAELISSAEVMPLGRGRANQAMRARLQAVRTTPAVHAGLWLRHNFWDEAHDLAQDLHTPEGSFWHAIIHRREPDAWNSNYWFRQVGTHPVVAQLATEAALLGYRYTSPAEFVQFCERVRDSNTSDEQLAIQVQMLEWRLLLEHCLRFKL